jgi:hypothetical protein
MAELVDVFGIGARVNYGLAAGTVLAAELEYA